MSVCQAKDKPFPIIFLANEQVLFLKFAKRYDYFLYFICLTQFTQSKKNLFM